MIRDAYTVAWKEWREFREQLFSRRGGAASAAILILVLGLVTPLQMREEWLTSSLMIGYWPFMAATLVSSLIADAVAGERERHTLETLLASRLPDGPILAGKVIAAVLYGVGLAGVNLFVGWVVVNIVAWPGHVLGFPAFNIGSILLLTLLSTTFFAGLGVFISLRSATVKQAQQAFGIIMLMIFLAPVLVTQALPFETRLRLLTSMTGVGRERIVGWAAAALALMSAVVLALARTQFRRGRLTLD